MQSESMRIDTRAAALIANSPHVRPRKLAVELDAGRLVVNGQVDTYFAKQMAQETLRAEGFVEIENRLEVVWS